MGSFGKGSLRKLCHTTLVYQSFLAATLIAALHCISSCHNQSSIESLWNHCSWLQVGRQCNHSICTLQLSTTTHSASHNHPPHALQTALREVAEILRKFLRKIVQNRFYCASEGCGHFAEILRKFAEMCGNFFGENSYSKCSAGCAQQCAHTSPLTLRVKMVLGLSDRADLSLGFSLQETLQ